MNSTLFAIVGIAIIAFLIYAFIRVLDESLWSLLVLVLVIGGLAIEHFYRSNIGTVLALLGIVILIIVYVRVVIMKKEYRSTKTSCYTPQSHTVSSFQPASSRQKANEARIHMDNVYELYRKAKAELEMLEQRRSTMDQAKYEEEYRAKFAIVADRKRKFDAAAEAYRQAELEAP